MLWQELDQMTMWGPVQPYFPIVLWSVTKLQFANKSVILNGLATRVLKEPADTLSKSIMHFFKTNPRELEEFPRTTGTANMVPIIWKRPKELDSFAWYHSLEKYWNIKLKIRDIEGTSDPEVKEGCWQRHNNIQWLEAEVRQIQPWKEKKKDFVFLQRIIRQCILWQEETLTTAWVVQARFGILPKMCKYNFWNKLCYLDTQGLAWLVVVTLGVWICTSLYCFLSIVSHGNDKRMFTGLQRLKSTTQH